MSHSRRLAERNCSGCDHRGCQPGQTGQQVSERDRIEVLPQARHKQDEQVTILLHKPVGFVSGQPRSEEHTSELQSH